MKVYAVIKELRVEDSTSRSFKLFEDKDDARQAFKDAVSSEKMSSEDAGWITEESEDCFESFKEGCESHNNGAILIQEIDVLERSVPQEPGPDYFRSLSKELLDTKKVLEDKAHSALVLLLSGLPGKCIFSNNALGYAMYESCNDDWVEVALHGIRLLDNGSLELTTELDWNPDLDMNVPCWEDARSEYDHYVLFDWISILSGIDMEFDNLQKQQNNA